MSAIEYDVTSKGNVVRFGSPFKIIGNINSLEGFTQFPISKRLKQIETFEEICLYDKSTEDYVYFKSSKLLRLHEIIFMITIMSNRTGKFKFFLAFEKEEEDINLKKFTINNLPFEIKREYFVSDVEDLEQMKRDIKNRVLFEAKDTKNKLNGMSVFE